MALEGQIPANWQSGCGQAPLFALILEWSVCQGDTLGLASMRRLFHTCFCHFQNVSFSFCTYLENREGGHFGGVCGESLVCIRGCVYFSL